MAAFSIPYLCIVADLLGQPAHVFDFSSLYHTFVSCPTVSIPYLSVMADLLSQPSHVFDFSAVGRRVADDVVGLGHRLLYEDVHGGVHGVEPLRGDVFVGTA